MTVKELIEQLQELQQDLPVYHSDGEGSGKLDLVYESSVTLYKPLPRGVTRTSKDFDVVKCVYLA